MKKTTNQLLSEYSDFMRATICEFARLESLQRSEATKRGIALAKARRLENVKVKKTA